MAPKRRKEDSEKKSLISWPTIISSFLTISGFLLTAGLVFGIASAGLDAECRERKTAISTVYEMHNRDIKSTRELFQVKLDSIAKDVKILLKRGE